MKILAGIAPRNHVLLAMDEMEGLRQLGVDCKMVSYGRNEPDASKLNKLLVVIKKAFAVVVNLYRHKPELLYLNSRLEPEASVRDFISLLIIKLFYVKRLKVVIKTHGSDLSIIQKPSFINHKIIVPFLTRFVDRWFFLSSDEKAEIKMLKPSFAQNIELIPNIITPSRCEAGESLCEKYDIPADKFKILFAGRMIREKGCFDVLRAIPFLPFKKDCVFLFMGDGDSLDELKEMAYELNILPYVKFLGFIPEAESDPLYSGVDLLVFPTYFNEGFPMVLFKSVAIGLPVITTRIRAAKDFLRSPQNVLWVDQQSPVMVAKAIGKIYKDVQLRRHMSVNNKMVGRLFTRDRVCKKIKTVFESIQ